MKPHICKKNGRWTISVTGVIDIWSYPPFLVADAWLRDRIARGLL